MPCLAQSTSKQAVFPTLPSAPNFRSQQQQHPEGTLCLSKKHRIKLAARNPSCKVGAAASSWQKWLSPPPFIHTSRDAMETFKGTAKQLPDMRGGREELPASCKAEGVPSIRQIGSGSRLSVRYFPPLPQQCQCWSSWEQEVCSTEIKAPPCCKCGWKQGCESEVREDGRTAHSCEAHCAF